MASIFTSLNIGALQLDISQKGLGIRPRNCPLGQRLVNSRTGWSPGVRPH
jgi:hypothetical protein